MGLTIRERMGVFMFRKMFGDKPWYKSVTAWGLVVFAMASTYCSFATGSAVLPFGDIVCQVGEKGGMILAALGIRKAATSANVG